MNKPREKMTGEKLRFHRAGLAIALMEASGLRDCYLVTRRRRNGRIYSVRETVPIQAAQ